MRSISRWALALTSCALAPLVLGGCTAVMTKYALAVPERDQPVPLEHRAGVTIAKLSSVDVAVEAQDTAGRLTIALPFPIPFPHLGHPPNPKQLPIWFEIAPEADSVTFDPRLLRIVSAAGDTLQPDGFWGPGVGAKSGELGDGHCSCGIPGDYSGIDRPFYKRWSKSLKYLECFNCYRPPGQSGTPSKPSAIEHPTCFVVDFPHPRGFAFTLLLDGVEVAGRPRAPLALHFKKGSRWGMTAFGGYGGVMSSS